MRRCGSQGTPLLRALLAVPWGPWCLELSSLSREIPAVGGLVPGLRLAHTYEGPPLSCGLGLGDTPPVLDAQPWGLSGPLGTCRLVSGSGAAHTRPKGGDPLTITAPTVLHTAATDGLPDQPRFPLRVATAACTATARATAQQQSPPRVRASRHSPRWGKHPRDFSPGEASSRWTLETLGSEGHMHLFVKFCDTFVKHKMQFLFKQKKAKINGKREDRFWVMV